MDLDALTYEVIGCAQKVHRALGPGFLERVYENALSIELSNSGISHQVQYPITVLYQGNPVGEYVADILVEDRLLVENKAVENVTKSHEVQLVNYLTATGIDTGLLLNFGENSLRVKRKFRVSSSKSC